MDGVRGIPQATAQRIWYEDSSSDEDDRAATPQATRVNRLRKRTLKRQHPPAQQSPFQVPEHQVHQLYDPPESNRELQPHTQLGSMQDDRFATDDVQVKQGSRTSGLTWLFGFAAITAVVCTTIGLLAHYDNLPTSGIPEEALLGTGAATGAIAFGSGGYLWGARNGQELEEGLRRF